MQTPSLIAATVGSGVITFAEKPLRVIRATTLYTATAGTRLQSGDLIESDQSITQIEGLAESNLAVGPNTRVAIDRKGAVTTLHLLSGWLKVQAASSAAIDSLDITTGTIRFDIGHSASVIHVSGNLVEVFVETGSLGLVELGKRGKGTRDATLTEDQYSRRRGEEPLQKAGRPSNAFIEGMPTPFFDPLISLTGKPTANVAPKKIRDVDFEDIAHWLRAPGLNPSSLATRFSPRLATPAFRKAIVREMGGSFEWENELYRFETRGRAVNKTSSALSSDLLRPKGA